MSGVDDDGFLLERLTLCRGDAPFNSAGRSGPRTIYLILRNVR